MNACRRFEDPDRITKLTYNAASELIKTTVAYGTAQQADDETNSYTLNGKLATVTDGENNRTTFEYDGHDRLGKTRYPVATPGALASSTTDYEQASYDANGNVTQRRLRDGQLIGSAYDNLNRATTKDLPAPESDLVYAYDLQGRMLSAVQGAQTSGMSYDALDRLVSETSGGYVNGLQYETAGRLTRVTHADGFYAGYVYNTTDLASINENGGTTLVSYIPNYRYERFRVITDGNLVVVHGRYNGLKPRPLITFDIFEVKEGKIVEHWDALQAEGPPNPSGRTMIDGATKITDRKRTAANRALVREAMETVLVRKELDRAGEFFTAGVYAQHNSLFPDGVAALVAGLRQLESAGQPLNYIKIHRIIAEGNYVLT